MARIRHAVTEGASRARTDEGRAGILKAGIRRLIRNGEAAASMAAIAAEANVSKALLHYPFHVHAQLLAELANVLGRRVITRERTALWREEAAVSVNLLWPWIHAELEGRELVANASVAFVDGLALDMELGRDARVSFNVFWLAMFWVGD